MPVPRAAAKPAGRGNGAVLSTASVSGASPTFVTWYVRTTGTPVSVVPKSCSDRPLSRFNPLAWSTTWISVSTLLNRSIRTASAITNPVATDV